MKKSKYLDKFNEFHEHITKDIALVEGRISSLSKTQEIINNMHKLAPDFFEKFPEIDGKLDGVTSTEYIENLKNELCGETTAKVFLLMHHYSHPEGDSSLSSKDKLDFIYVLVKSNELLEKIETLVGGEEEFEKRLVKSIKGRDEKAEFDEKAINDYVQKFKGIRIAAKLASASTNNGELLEIVRK